MVAHFITAEGTISTLLPSNGIHFTPDEMQKKVGGEFEFLLTLEKHTLVVNKEANEKNIMPNDEASKLIPNTQIYGDVIVCKW